MHEGIPELEEEYAFKQGYLDPLDKVITEIWMPHIVKTY